MVSLPRLRAAALLGAALPLAACISFGAKPPPSLLTLQPTTPLPAGPAQTAVAGRTITIRVPATPQEIAGVAVPVRATDTTLAYIKDAVWVEPPSRLFARLVSDTVAGDTGRVVLDPRQFNQDPGALLSGELRSFGVDAASSSAVVIFDGTLARGGTAGIEKRRFEARVPIAAIDAPSAGQGLNQAANQVAHDVAAWVGR